MDSDLIFLTSPPRWHLDNNQSNSITTYTTLTPCLQIILTNLNIVIDITIDGNMTHH